MAQAAFKADIGQFKVSPWVDVKAYGAVGNGVTDDTTAIQNAINAATAAHGKLFFPTGTYIITSTLNFLNVYAFEVTGLGSNDNGVGNVTLQWNGAAGGTVLRLDRCRAASFSKFWIVDGTAVPGTGILIDITVAGSVTTTNLKFNEVSVVGATRAVDLSPVSVANCELMDFTKCYFSGVHTDKSGDGIRISSFNSQQVAMRSCSFTDFNNGANIVKGNANFEECNFGQNITDIMLVNPGKSVLVSRCHTEGSTRFLDTPATGFADAVVVQASSIFCGDVNADNQMIRFRLRGVLSLLGNEIVNGTGITQPNLKIACGSSDPGCTLVAIGNRFENATPYLASSGAGNGLYLTSLGNVYHTTPSGDDAPLANYIGAFDVTGAQPFTTINNLSFKGSPWYDVKAYGAIGDGVTDDTAAIVAALAACPEGGTVFFPLGTFKFTTLTITKAVRLLGVGWQNDPALVGSMLKSTATSGTAISILTSGTSAHKSTIEHLAVIGPASGTAIGIAMGAATTFVTSAYWEDVFVGRFGTQVVLTNVMDSQFNALRVQEGATGLKLLSQTNQNVFVNFQAQVTTGQALQIGTSSAGTDASLNAFVGGLIQNNTGGGVLIQNGTGNKFDSIWFENSSLSLPAFSIDGVTGSTVVQGMVVSRCNFNTTTDTVSITGVNNGSGRHVLEYNRFHGPVSIGNNVPYMLTLRNVYDSTFTTLSGLGSRIVDGNGITTFGEPVQAPLVDSPQVSYAGTQLIGTTVGSALDFMTNATQRWEITPTGHFVAIADNQYDIGATSANRPRTVYSGTSVIAPTGTFATSVVSPLVNTSDIKPAAAGVLDLESNGAQRVQIKTNGTTKWAVEGTGELTSDTHSDIGASGSEVGNIRVYNGTGAGDGKAVVNHVVAGTPTDARFSSPQSGMFVVDTAASKIWVRFGSTWKSATLT